MTLVRSAEAKGRKLVATYSSSTTLRAQYKPYNINVLRVYWQRGCEVRLYIDIGSPRKLIDLQVW